MARHNDPKPPLPDILRPTELCDFGEAFSRGRHRRKILGLALAAAGLWALSQAGTPMSPDADLGETLAASAPAR